MIATQTKKEAMYERIRDHGNRLLAIFPYAKERDPVRLCKRLRRLEAEAYAFSLRCCNGPEFADGEDDAIKEAILKKVNALLGNVSEYQPKTGHACGCRRGQQRDNCPNCEGTGMVVDFRAIRNRPLCVPVKLNMDARGYALKIDDEWMRAQRADSRTAHKATLHQDWGGYGIIAPDLTEGY